MRKFSSLLCAVILSTQTMVYAADNTQNVHHQLVQDKIPAKIQPAPPSDDDKLRSETMTPDAQPAQKLDLTETEWRANPHRLQQTLIYFLATNQVHRLNDLPELYGLLPQNARDDSLIEWANAMRLTQTNLKRSIHEYRVLMGKFPNNDFIRFQLATLLYQNQEFDAAKGQFEKLRASSQMKQSDLAVLDKYLSAIAKKDKWKFSLGSSFLYDKNLTDVAEKGTVMKLPSGGTLTQENERESGAGFDLSVGTEKQWSLKSGQYVGLEGSTNLKYYWNNKQFNDLSAQVGTSYGYANSNFDVKISPYMTKRWYAGGGANDSNRLKSYTNTLGASASISSWLKPNLKHSVNFGYARQKYTNDKTDARYGGHVKSAGTSLLYLNGAKQYFGTGLDISRRDAGSAVNSYKRYGARVFWGQEWPKGFATQTSVGMAKRQYDGKWLGIKQRDDKELNVNMSLWHKAVHFYGVTPRLNYQYQQTNSNIPIYSYHKNMLFVQLDKSF